MNYKEAYERLAAQIRNLGIAGDVQIDNQSVYFGDRFSSKRLETEALKTVEALNRTVLEMSQPPTTLSGVKLEDIPTSYIPKYSTGDTIKIKTGAYADYTGIIMYSRWLPDSPKEPGNPMLYSHKYTIWFNQLGHSVDLEEDAITPI